jgi:hypothetical protein
MQREDLIKLAREAASGAHVIGPDGSVTRLPAVLDATKFNPPEWVLEAMQRAYNQGARDAHRAVVGGLYPEGG